MQSKITLNQRERKRLTIYRLKVGSDEHLRR